MDGQAIVENYRQMGKEPEFTKLDINQLKLHLAKYLIRLMSPIMEFKPTVVPGSSGSMGGERLGILRKNQGVSEYMSTDEYRHYMAFTLIPEVEEIAKKYKEMPNFLGTRDIVASSMKGKVLAKKVITKSPQERYHLTFDEVRPTLRDLFPEMDLTEDPRDYLGESWDSFFRRCRPNFSTLLRLLYDVSYDIPEDAILSYLRGTDQGNWEITSNSD
jgi:hypothetical protein